MPFAPQTFSALQKVQARMQSEVLVNGVSPFTAFSTADVAKYGTTNAIYIGYPKEFSTNYPRQCHIIPPIDETVYRRALGGKVWAEQCVYVRLVFLNATNWYQAQQDIIAAADVMHQVLNKHAELPGAVTVRATKEQAKAAGMPTGFHFDDLVGREWVCWGFVLWLNQEWTVQGGIIQ